MSTSKTLKTFLNYLIPSMLGMALVAIYTFTDTFVVGRELGAIAMGAMGICTPVLTISYALGFLYGMGGGTLYAISVGRKEADEANKFFTTSLFMLLITGTVLAVAGNLFCIQLANVLGADDTNLVYVMPYLRCIVTYIPGFMLDVFIMTYMKNVGHPTVAMTATVTGTVLNIILDLLFVFVFKWGMFGAAFATCIGSFVASAINVIYIFNKKLNLIPRIKNITNGYIFRIFKTGFSVFVLECSSGIVTFAFIRQSTKFYGSIGASVYTVIMNWTLICFNLLMGISQSVQPLISVSYGEKNIQNVRIYRKYAIVSSIIAGILFLLIGYSMTEPLVGVFAKDSTELVSMSLHCFKMYLPAYFIMGIGISIGIYFQSVEESLKSLTIMLLRGILLPVLFVFLLPIVFGKDSLWICVPIAELITAVAAVLMLVMAKKSITQNCETTDIADTVSQNYVITISREFGSGGRAIGKALGEALGVPVYDKELSEITATYTGFHAESIKMEEDKKIIPYGLYVKNHYTPISNKIFSEQCKVINQIAQKSSCVIIGRCADYVLQESLSVFRVFVHAPLEMRAARVAEYDNCTVNEAVKKIKESDEARLSYHEYFTHMEWGKAQNYDITINSEIGLENAVKVILQNFHFYQER